MTVPILKIKVLQKPVVKGRMDVRFPANIHTEKFLTVSRANGTYTFDVDYSLLTAGPILDPATAYIAVNDHAAGLYKTVTLASLLTSGLDADLQAIAALTGAGILARTADDTWALRAVTGTANEITVTNGDGVAGAPTVSLPAALTFTGKTVTGGTFNGLTITGSTFNGNAWTAGTGTLTLGAGKTATIGNTLTFTGTDASSVAFGTGGTVAYQGGTLAQFAATTSAQLKGVISDETGSGALVFSTSPSLTTPIFAQIVNTGTLTLPTATDTLVGRATTDTLTGKTISGSSNTLSNIGNSSLTNSSMTIAGHLVSLGGSQAIAAADLSNGVTGTGAVVLAASPALTGTPTAPTAAASDNSTKIATTAYVDAQVAGGVAGVASIGTQTGALTVPGGNFASTALPLLRYDAAQTLTTPQKAQVLTNIGDTRDTPRILTVSTAVSTIDVTGIDVIQYTSASSTTITSMSGVIVGKTYMFMNTGTGVLTISRSFAVLYGSANAVLNQHYCLPAIGRSPTSIYGLGPTSTNG